MEHVDVAIIGAGPAGLMAAERLTELGLTPHVFEAMPSPARKLLMAGKSGLNISHNEEISSFLSTYQNADPRLERAVRAYDSSAVRAWMSSLGVDSFIGPTGRIFPRAMKASPLLRAWLGRLDALGVSLSLRHLWRGCDSDGHLLFQTTEGERKVAARATILGLGGASWSRLGSDGKWAAHMDNTHLSPFAPSNCGFVVPWSAHFAERHAGAAVKSVRVSINDKSSRAEFVITAHGLESGAIYQLSHEIMHTLEREGHAKLSLNLTPDQSLEKLKAALSKVPKGQSLSNRLRRAARLSPVKIGLLREGTPKERLTSAEEIAAAIISTPLTITAPTPMDEAISTRGGIRWDSLDENLMLRDRENVFCAGEMIEWDAPTGGYLLTACLALGRAAAEGLVRHRASQA